MNDDDKNQIQSFDIAVSGAGIAGLVFAQLMANLGLKIALIDPAPPPPPSNIGPSGKTVALMESSLNILKASGFSQDLIDEHGSPLKTMRIIDDSIAGSKTIRSEFHARDIGMDYYGYNIPNGILRALLYDQGSAHQNITMFCPDALEGYHIDKNTSLIQLTSGKRLKAALLIGADGRNSPVRTLSNIDVWHHDYGQSAITFLIHHSKDHHNYATEFHRPGGPLALVPLKRKSSSVVWVDKANKVEELLHLKKQDLEAVFQNLTHNILGQIEIKTGIASWPLQTLKAESLTAPHVALIAEAAHVMSPITAQGLNLSLRDVGTLAEILADGLRCGSSLGDPALLAQYEKQRNFDLNTRIHGVDTMMKWVSQDKTPLKWVRRMGLGAVENIPPLKRFSMHHGLAPSVGLGRLAKGEQL